MAAVVTVTAERRRAARRIVGPTGAALAAIAAAAAGVRLLGLTFGLPAVYNPDEVAIMSRALAFATGDLNPHNFLYPTFYFYLLFAWVGGSFVVSWIAGLVPSVAAFQTLFFTDPTNIYLAGRLLGVACGTITVLLTYALGGRVAGKTAGLAAALFLAAAPTHVRDSHYVKHDVPATLAIVIAQLAILRLLGERDTARTSPPTSPPDGSTRGGPPRGAQSGARKAANPSPQPSPRERGEGARVIRSPGFVAGAACGLACATHYYALFLAVPLLMALWLRHGPRIGSGRSHEPDARTIATESPAHARTSGATGAGDATGAADPAADARGWGPLTGRLIDAGLAAVIVFFALSPFLLVEPLTAWQDIVANRRIVVDRAVGTQHGLFAGAGAYARMLWSEAIGWPVLLAAIAGFVIAARRLPRKTMVLVAFPAGFLLFISNTVPASRYLNPVLPTLAVLAAVAVARAAEALARATRGWAGLGQPAYGEPASGEALPSRPPSARVSTSAGGLAVAIAAVLALLLAVPGALLSLRLGLFFRQADTRTLAQQIVERDLPAGSTVLIQPYSVPLTQSRESLVEALEAHLGDAGRASRKFALRLALDPYPAPAYRTIFLGDGGLDVDKIYLGYTEVSGPDALEALRRAGVQYVLLKRYNVEDSAAVPLRTLLRQRGRLLASVSPYTAGADAVTRARVAPFLHNTDTPYDPALERPGPGIEVWQTVP